MCCRISLFLSHFLLLSQIIHLVCFICFISGKGCSLSMFPTIHHPNNNYKCTQESSYLCQSQTVFLTSIKWHQIAHTTTVICCLKKTLIYCICGPSFKYLPHRRNQSLGVRLSAKTQDSKIRKYVRCQKKSSNVNFLKTNESVVFAAGNTEYVIDLFF